MPKNLNNFCTWRRLDLSREDDYALWEQRSATLSDPERPRSLYTEPTWIAGRESSQLSRLAVYEKEGSLAVFILGPGTLPLYMGEVVVGKIPFRRASLADFRVVPGLGSNELLLASLLRTARNDLGGDVVLHIETNGLGFAKELDAVRSSDFSRKWLWLNRDTYMHRFVRFDGTFEKYYGTLSGQLRRNVKRGRAKFVADYHGDPQLIRVTEASQINDFLHRAEQVSRKTHQFRMLGLGIRDIEKKKLSFGFAADQGWLRSYLFYAGEEPVAFIEGFQYAGTFQGSHHGYDPKYAKYSIGILLWIAALSDLYESAKPGWLDFGSGDALYKRMLSNTETAGVRAYLWPATCMNRMKVGLYRSVEALNRFGSRMAARFQLKARFKKFFRDRARKPDDEM